MAISLNFTINQLSETVLFFDYENPGIELIHMIISLLVYEFWHNL